MLYKNVETLTSTKLSFYSFPWYQYVSMISSTRSQQNMGDFSPSEMLSQRVRARVGGNLAEKGQCQHFVERFSYLMVRRERFGARENQQHDRAARSLNMAEACCM